MDDRSLRVLLEKSEREWSAVHGGGVAGFWAVAALVLTGMAGGLALPLFRPDVFFPLQRTLYLGVTLVFAVLALYCWVRFLRALARR